MNGDLSGGVCPVCRKFRAKCPEQLERHASTCQDKTRLRFGSSGQSADFLKHFRATSETCSKCRQTVRDVTKGGETEEQHSGAAWSLHSTNSAKSAGLYGGMPILYHTACAAVDPDAVTDEAIVSAYKKHAAAAPRKVRFVSPRGVGLDAMRVLSNRLAAEHRVTAGLRKTEQPADTEQEGGNGAAEHDSDSDDSRPLGELVQDMEPSQLAAKRTPFLVAAQTTVSEASDDAVHAESGPKLSTDIMVMQRSSAAAAAQQIQPANKGSGPVSGSKLGHVWEFKGFVTQKPPLEAGEKRVLSSHFSKGVTAAYIEAQQDVDWKIKVLEFAEDGATHCTTKFRDDVKKSVTVYLKRHMPAGKSLLLDNLPEDPPCLESLTLQTVREGDFRKGLRPGIDYTVFTKIAIAKAGVIGLYRAKTVTKNEEKSIKLKAPPAFNGTRQQWRQIMDAYAADILQPAQGTKSWKSCKDIFNDVLQGQPLSCLAYGHGNMTACINDGLGDPMSDEPDPDAVDMAANVALVPIAIGRWPFLFVIAIENIEAGGELFLSYGQGFWDLQQFWAQTIQEQLEDDRTKDLERARTSGTLGFDSAGGSQLRTARSEPPTETAMSATQNPTPTASIQHAPTAPVTLPEDSLPPANIEPSEHKDVRQEDAAESQPASSATLSGSPMHLDSNDPVAEAKNVTPALAQLKAVAIETAQDQSSPNRSSAEKKLLPDMTLLSSERRGSDSRDRSRAILMTAATTSGLASPGKAGKKRQREHDSETHASCWRKPLPLAAGMEESIRLGLIHVQEPQTLAAQKATEAFGQKRRSRFAELSAAFQECMRQHGPSAFTDTALHLPKKPLVMTPSPQRQHQQQARQDAGTDAQRDRHTADHRDAPRAALPGPDAGEEPSQGAEPAAQQGEPMYSSDLRHQHLREAACHVQQRGATPHKPSQPDFAVPQSDSDQLPAPVQHRQLARLDSRTGSSSSAGKDFFLPVPTHRSPQSPPPLQPLGNPQQSDQQPLPTRALHKQLSVNSRAFPDAINASNHALNSDRANQARAASQPVSGQRFSQATGKQTAVHTSRQPPKFGDARPGLGKSRLAMASEQSKGGSVASGALSNDSSSKHQSKTSGSGRAAIAAGTQDTATAPDSPKRRAKGLRAPVDAELTQVPRPSMKDRHSASFGLKPSKGLPDSRPSAAPAGSVCDKSKSHADEIDSH